jgi:chromosomal replication initiation ATPase DnaA
MRGAVRQELRTPSYALHWNGARPGVSKAAAREIVEQAVSLAFGVSAGELRAPTRCKAPVAFARQVAMYLAHIACGLSLTEVGTLFGRDRTTVAYACSVVEDRRDEPDFDRSLDYLEAAIGTLAKAWIDLQSGRRL